MMKFKVGDTVEWKHGDNIVETLEIESFDGGEVWFTEGGWLSEDRVNAECKLVSRAKPDAEKRRVIQIATDMEGCLNVLCNDGTLWYLAFSNLQWHRLPDIPQDEDGETGQ